MVEENGEDGWRSKRWDRASPDFNSHAKQPRGVHTRTAHIGISISISCKASKISARRRARSRDDTASRDNRSYNSISISLGRGRRRSTRDRKGCNASPIFRLNIIKFTRARKRDAETWRGGREKHLRETVGFPGSRRLRNPRNKFSRLRELKNTRHACKTCAKREILTCRGTIVNNKNIF